MTAEAADALITKARSIYDEKPSFEEPTFGNAVLRAFLFRLDVHEAKIIELEVELAGYRGAFGTPAELAVAIKALAFQLKAKAQADLLKKNDGG